MNYTDKLQIKGYDQGPLRINLCKQRWPKWLINMAEKKNCQNNWCLTGLT